jgi:hypothetical protein
MRSTRHAVALQHLAFVIASVFGGVAFVGCREATPDVPASGFRVQVAETRYTISPATRAAGVAYRVENRTADTLVVRRCGAVGVQKLEGARHPYWKPFDSMVCPSIGMPVYVLAPGSQYASTLGISSPGRFRLTVVGSTRSAAVVTATSPEIDVKN